MPKSDTRYVGYSYSNYHLVRPGKDAESDDFRLSIRSDLLTVMDWKEGDLLRIVHVGGENYRFVRINGNEGNK